MLILKTRSCKHSVVRTLGKATLNQRRSAVSVLTWSTGVQSATSGADQYATAPSGSSAPVLRGVVYIHSCPRALIRHVEWALTNALGPSVHLEWIDQPVQPGTQRTEFSWRAKPGTAARLATDLRAFPGLRFEVTQEPGGLTEGERYACTPSLGIFRAAMGPHGDVLVNEERLRSAMAKAANGADLTTELNSLLGSAWDAELEAFRYAGEGSSVRWVHEVG